jgi:hypothetical protein
VSKLGRKTPTKAS